MCSFGGQAHPRGQCSLASLVKPPCGLEMVPDGYLSYIFVSVSWNISCLAGTFRNHFNPSSASSLGVVVGLFIVSRLVMQRRMSGDSDMFPCRFHAFGIELLRRLLVICGFVSAFRASFVVTRRVPVLDIEFDSWLDC